MTRLLRSAVLGMACVAPFFSALAGKERDRILGTDEDGPVARFAPGAFPEETDDKRRTPQRHEFAIRNALQRERDRGTFPDHTGLHFSSIVAGLTALARIDGDGRGAWCTLETWAHEAGLDCDTCSAVERWAVRVGYMDAFKRRRRDERVGRKWSGQGADENGEAPSTPNRSTLRFLYLCPRDRARTMTEAELLGSHHTRRPARDPGGSLVAGPLAAGGDGTWHGHAGGEGAHCEFIDAPLSTRSAG